MAEIGELQTQLEDDEEQWLYGDEQDESKEDGEINNEGEEGGEKETEENGVANETPMEEGEKEDKQTEDGEKDKGKDKDDSKKGSDKDGDKEDGEKGDDDSSDEDDLTITIGVLKTQPDIIQAPSAPHGARFQPKAAPTTGLKDDDFNSPGKVNGVPVTEFTFNDMEDKPWRKPGADISDYFNYGFNEETWFKYCERQKRMRVTESGAGLSGLGVSVTKPFGNASSTNIPVAIVNDNSKYGGTSSRPKAGPPPRTINKPSGQIDVISSKIQVMTADRREYSNKVMNGPPPVPPPFIPGPGYNDMEFGGNPYGETFYPPPEAPPYYGGPPPPFAPIPWGSGDAPISNQSNWEGGGAPNVTPVSSGSNYYDDNSNMSAPPPVAEQQDEERHRSRRSHRSRSRSPSRHKHSSSRHGRSRSRSPSHRHKRKKSKRERDAD